MFDCYIFNWKLTSKPDLYMIFLLMKNLCYYTWCWGSVEGKKPLYFLNIRCLRGLAKADLNWNLSRRIFCRSGKHPHFRLSHLFLHPSLIVFPNTPQISSPNNCSCSQSWFLLLRPVTQEPIGSPDGFSPAKERTLPKCPSCQDESLLSLFWMSVAGVILALMERVIKLQCFSRAPDIQQRDQLLSLLSGRIRNPGKPNQPVRCQITTSPVFTGPRWLRDSHWC